MARFSNLRFGPRSAPTRSRRPPKQTESDDTKPRPCRDRIQPARRTFRNDILDPASHVYLAKPSCDRLSRGLFRFAFESVKNSLPELAETAQRQRPPEAVTALGSLLSDDDPQVRNAASRWARPYMPVHQGQGSLGIPVELRPLVRSTVLGADRHGLEIELLVSLAQHGPEAALSALDILGELLELHPPNGMLDMVAHYALDVAYAAHESLSRDDRAPALERIDAVIRRDPIATLVKLDSIREKSAD